MADDLMAAIERGLCEKYYHMPSTRARVRRVVLDIFAALRDGQELEAYAQIKYGFWYKVYIFTPHGVLKVDTGSERLEAKAFAKRVIQVRDLRPVPLSAVLNNWEMGGFWPSGRPLMVLVLDMWREGKVAFYAKNRSAA
jgi:hypothetical protein